MLPHGDDPGRVPGARVGVALGTRIVVDAKSGVSGAGRTPAPGSHFVQANESCSPYKVGNHRHTPEMEQALSAVAGREVSVMFTPHLVPMSRGLLSTVYLDVEKGLTTVEAVELYRGRYHAEPFVHVHAAGTMPSTAEVRGTNRASIGVHVDERTSTLVAVCAIDKWARARPDRRYSASTRFSAWSRRRVSMQRHRWCEGHDRAGSPRLLARGGRRRRRDGFRRAGCSWASSRTAAGSRLRRAEGSVPAAAVFTSNAIVAAPVIVSPGTHRLGRARAVVVNAGNANACTGRQG